MQQILVAAQVGFTVHFAPAAAGGDGVNVSAIFEEDDLPEKWSEYTELNEKLALEWPVITEQKDPMPSSDEFKDVEAKRDLLSETAGG